jgi:hypothetical protein
METHDFKCCLCATRWLKYTENNIPSSSSLHYGRRHNFDFGKSIKVARRKTNQDTRSKKGQDNI